ncbi:MAG TPA: hypothetical protein VNB22_09590 [Pyrinomonadaceae bacterium]|jgi:hypothetical protein|nr:hypothetical protein [Pyrinomonadaceae bacterium]
MKNRPIHENLDTSFVNLSALVKYLRRRQFAGYVRIELSGYEADIYLTAENQLKVREYDHIAGRIAEGEEALQRILIRSREPGGIINVYQTVAESEAIVEKKEAIVEKKEPVIEREPLLENKPLPAQTNGANGNGNGKPKIEFPVNGQAPNGNGKSAPLKSDEPPPLAPKSKLPNLPFEFTNKVESRAKQQNLSNEDRAMLLNLTGELLGTVDRCLGMAKLEFSTAFQKACAEISADYPFLTTLDYQKGKITVSEQTNPKFFVAGVLEALRRILEKLGGNPKFGEVYRYTTQRMLALIHQRKPFYDKFFITKPLEKILGA